MTPSSSLGLSGERFAVHYHVKGAEGDARRKAEAICLDQTVEMSAELVPNEEIRNHILGRLEGFRPIALDVYEAVVSFAVEVTGSELPHLLQIVFGMLSLKPGIRVSSIELSKSLIDGMNGPRFGRAGLREKVGQPQRPLLCGVLKPVGLCVTDLAKLAYSYALGGLDIIKDDQGLANQAFCPFEERVRRCAEAVEKANQQTGRNALYLPNVTGPFDQILPRALFAGETGAGGLLICPGMTGFDVIRCLAVHKNLALPILSHPGGLGSLIVHDDTGIAPSVLFGQIPRLFGVDASLFPVFGRDFSISRDQCAQIAGETGKPLRHMKAILPAVGGHLGLERIPEILELFGMEVMVVVGGTLLQHPNKVVETCQNFVRAVERSC